MKPLLSSCRTDYQKQVDNFPFIGEIAKPTEPATVKMNCTFHEPPLTASTVFADRQSSRSFGRWQISKRKIWTPGCGAGVEPTIYRKKTEGGVNMDVVKLPKKVRMVCYEIMDGKEEAWTRWNPLPINIPIRLRRSRPRSPISTWTMKRRWLWIWPSFPGWRSGITAM